MLKPAGIIKVIPNAGIKVDLRLTIIANIEDPGKFAGCTGINTRFPGEYIGGI